MTVTVTTEGFVATGFEPVRHAFERNFSERGELGAAFAAVRDGEVLVDLWGGLADRPRRAPWRERTMQPIFSGSKGLVAMCLLLLLDRGELELEAPVSRYWPEFAAAGKRGVTVTEVVTHTARLPGITRELTVAELPDDELMAQLLAAQSQLSDARARNAYHPLTYGWLCGELVRRIDGRSIGRFFADELARPLDVDVHIGLPEELESHVARLELADTWGSKAVFEPSREDDELAWAVWGNPAFLGRTDFPWNLRGYHASEIPAANGIGTARGIATLYAQLRTLVSEETFRLAGTPLERRHEPLVDMPQAFGVGFMLQTALQQFGPPPDAFGHTGAGGSVHGVWPAERVGFSYAMNLMHDDADVDPRSRAVIDALHASLAGINKEEREDG